jgi:ribosomal protein S20
MPCIKQDAPIPLDLLLEGLSACLRTRQNLEEAAHGAALRAALRTIGMEIENKVKQGTQLDMTYYQQLKRNEDENISSVVQARKMENGRDV